MKLFKIIILPVFIVFFIISCDEITLGSKVDTKVDSEIDSVSYALGLNIGANLKDQFGEVNPHIIAEAIEDYYNEEEKYFTRHELNVYIQKYYDKMRASMDEERRLEAEKNLKTGQDFLEDNKTKEGVVTTASGLQYKVIEEGAGPNPTATDKVRVHYKGTTIDGEEFDSSYERGEPTEFPLNRVIRGWTEGIQLMNPGSKFIFYIPSELAYGERGSRPKIQPNEVLIFEVELLEIVP